MCLSFSRPCFFYCLLNFFSTFFLTSFFPPPNSVSSNTVFGPNRRAQAFLLADNDRKEQLRHRNALCFFPCLSKYLCSFPFQLPGRCAGCQPTTKDKTTIPHFFLHAILLQDSGLGNNPWQLLLWLHKLTEILGLLTSHCIFITNPIKIWFIVSSIWGIVPSHSSEQIFTKTTPTFLLICDGQNLRFFCPNPVHIL